MTEYILFDMPDKIDFHSAGLFLTHEPWKHAERTMDNFEFILGVKNHLPITVDGQTYEVGSGDLLCIPPDTKHWGTRETHTELSFYWFHISVATAPERFTETQMLAYLRNSPESADQKWVFPKFLHLKKANKIYILLNELFDSMKKATVNPFYLNIQLLHILLEISEQTKEQLLEAVDERSAGRNLSFVEEWIRIHYQQECSLSEIAKHFGYNEKYLSRIFVQYTNQTINQFVHSLRMQKAKELLLNTSLSIKEIAYEVGFEDEKYFMRLFKKYERMTPSQYRQTFQTIRLNKK